MKNLLSTGILAICLAWVTFPPSANAASNLTAGDFAEFDPTGASYRDLGICQFYTGPRAGLPAGKFLMQIGDRHSFDYGELQITGDVTTVVSPLTGDVEYRLFPDDPAAASFFQSVLRRQLGDPKVGFTLYSLAAHVGEVYGPNSENDFTCRVSLTGRADGVPGGSAPVSLNFAGDGQFTPGIDTASSRGAATAAGDPPCPTTLLAPDGLDPIPGKCDTPDCLLDFKKYKWWTSFNLRGASFPDKSFYWNNDLKNSFAPKNAFVDAAGLHLTIQTRDLGAGPVPAAAEVVAMFHSDGSEANLGYGKYLVTATTKTASSWNDLDPNVAFGDFTFERVGTGGGTGTLKNPNREIDLAEVSRFGFPAGDPACPKDLRQGKSASATRSSPCNYTIKTLTIGTGT